MPFNAPDHGIKLQSTAVTLWGDSLKDENGFTPRSTANAVNARQQQIQDPIYPSISTAAPLAPPDEDRSAEQTCKKPEGLSELPSLASAQ